MSDKRTGFNNLKVSIPGVTEPELYKAENITLETFYPGGLFGSSSFYVPRDITASWQVEPNQRVQIRNGLNTVYEGYVTTPAIDLQDTTQGQPVTLTGAWGNFLVSRGWRKPWCEMRTDEQTWQKPTAAYSGYDISMLDKMSVDQNNRVRFTPNSEPFENARYCRRVYTAPTGETIKRIVFNWSMGASYEIPPRKVYHFDSAVYNNKTNCKDGLLTTSDTITIATTHYLYIAIEEMRSFLDGIRFDLGATVNTNASVMSAEFWNGAAWTALTITDGTAVAGKTLAQDGTVSFVKPVNWAPTGVGAPINAYWLRLKVSANLTAVNIIEIVWSEAQQWQLGVYDVAAPGTVWFTNTAGSGSQDIALATPRSNLWLYFEPTAADTQTPGSNGTVFGEFSGLKVYTETGSINPTEIVKDVAGHVTELSTDLGLIASNVQTLEPFVSDSDKLDQILTNVMAYGDSSNNNWAAGIRETDLASDGKPIMFFEQFSALTDYDYAVRLDEPNLVPPFTAEQDISTVANWIPVSYTDAGGVTRYVTPDDDATLKDTASITAYGERHPESWPSVNTTSLTLAKAYAKRMLAARKDPQWTVSSGITVRGYIRGKSGQAVPASEIRAGMRIKVENFLNDLSGTGLTFLITRTSYNDADETCSMSVGETLDFDVWLNRMLDYGSRGNEKGGG